jgi:tRNA-specific 2-thiouridylase
MSKVVVGLSGGVDSSVAAHLLIEQGHEVIGVFMRNWNDESVIIDDECPWIDDSNDALAVAEKLGIPFQVVDFSEPYKKRIVDYMFDEYNRGRTPNPDVLCNREIKFDVFLETAVRLGADFVATGHYCQKGETADGSFQLLAGADPGKDQSYFLCQLNQEQLSKALFPIGHMQKSEVRELARELDLVTADKKDSQGLCFIGKVKLPVFLQQQLAPKTGDIIEINKERIPERVLVGSDERESLEEITRGHGFSKDWGNKIGEHPGAHYFTVGQRKGLDVGGTAEPLFVVGIDTGENIIYTGQGTDHSGLYRKGLKVESGDIHWIRPDQSLQPGESRSFMVRIRYRQPLFKATLHQEPEHLYIVFDDPQKSVAPGQFVAWYDGEELIGSGVIA